MSLDSVMRVTKSDQGYDCSDGVLIGLCMLDA